MSLSHLSAMAPTLPAGCTIMFNYFAPPDRDQSLYLLGFGILVIQLYIALWRDSVGAQSILSVEHTQCSSSTSYPHLICKRPPHLATMLSTKFIMPHLRNPCSWHSTLFSGLFFVWSDRF
jgi:hypothetical protein